SDLCKVLTLIFYLMKKSLLLASLLVGGAFSMNAQTVLFEDGFEEYDDFLTSGVGNWTITDVDGSTSYGFQGIQFPGSGSAFGFIVFNPSMTTPTAGDIEALAPNNGNKYMASLDRKSVV